MDDIDPALVKHWAKTTATAHRPATRNGGAVQIPLTQHPAIRQQAMARFVQDEADAQIAALRVKRSSVPLDLRVIRWTGRLLFGLYVYPRDFVIAHAGFVSAQKRAFRLTACHACTFHKDRGDFMIYCMPMLEKCKCPVWLLTCLSWLTCLRDTKCPLSRWDKAEAAADEIAGQAKEDRTAMRTGGCGK